MKDGVKNIKSFVAQKSLVSALWYVAVAAFSFLGARAPIINVCTPFGLSFAAGAPSPYIISATIGAAFGYLFPVSNGGTFRYLAALFAICTIRLLLLNIGSFSKRAFWSATVCFATATSTAFAAVAGGNFSPLYALSESILAAAGSYFVFKTTAIKRDLSVGATPTVLASAVIVLNILLLGLYPLTIGPISIGRIFAVCIILAVARYAHTSGGAVAGAVCSLFGMLSGTSNFFSASTLAAGGLLCGIFGAVGRFATAAVFVAFSAVCAILLGDKSASLLLCEAAFGAALFLCLPKTICLYFGKLFSAPTSCPSFEGLKKALTMRLMFASQALYDVSSTVKEVSSELKNINSPELSWVVEMVKRDGCGGCSLIEYCWSTKEKETRDAVLHLSRLSATGNEHPLEAAPPDFLARCRRPLKVESATLKYFEEYASKLAAESRIEEIRGAVSDQFEGISEMLYDLSEEFARVESFDSKIATRLSLLLRENGIYATDVAVKDDKYGRTSIEIHLSLPKNAPLDRALILRAAEAVCEKVFELPTVERVKSDVFINICERVSYTVSVGVTQLVSGDGKISGDAYTTFDDGKGRKILLLSDGMGTGGRAAVDGAMASGLMERLLKAGFGYDCALKIVNSSMLFKSTDESLATLDISTIDLYDGKVELLKLGAAPTIVRRNGRCGRASSTSLPAGILRDIGFDRAALSLRDGDILLMMSDGVCADGTDWICGEIENFKGYDAQALSEKIAYIARRRRTDGHDDDITVIAAILEKGA